MNSGSRGRELGPRSARVLSEDVIAHFRQASWSVSAPLPGPTPGPRLCRTTSIPLDKEAASDGWPPAISPTALQCRYAAGAGATSGRAKLGMNGCWKYRISC